MTRFALVVSCLIVLFAATMSSADFPRRGRSCVSPSYSPCYHETVAVAAVVPTVTVVETPLPVFVFQSLSGYSSLPASVTTPQNQYQSPTQAQPPQIGLNDRDIEKIANVVVQRLQGTAMVQQTNLLMPPRLEDEQPQQTAISQTQINSIGRACAVCHQSGGTTKSNLAIFDQFGNFDPKKNGQPYQELHRIFERAQEGSMPPSAMSDPSKKLDPDGLAGLAKLTGRTQ